MTVQRLELSGDQLEYLKAASFLPARLAALIGGAEPIPGEERWAVAVSPSVAEEFRSAFTERLAAAGFDVDYEPTLEGSLLEDLIDRFRVV